MSDYNPSESEKHPPRYCPECGEEAGYMNVLMFLGIQPDGYVCRTCKGYYAEIEGELKNLAAVIS